MHEGLAWFEGSHEGREWLARLPSIIVECADAWSLTVGEPFAYAFASLAMPVERADGSAAVLKVSFPGRESEHEAAALALMDGDGAVRLLEYDERRRALLLERAEPGTPLKELGLDRALDVFVDLLPRLWKPAGAPFRPLAEEAAWWAETIVEDFARTGHPFERALLDAALDAIETLEPDAGGAGARQPGHARGQRRSRRNASRG